MEAYVLEWINLLLRWAHVIVGIAWIGASFYFIWLDNHLEPARDAKLAGELWSVHGGGFYRAEKFRVAPAQLPTTLHWFKWEAYWTWITGFALLVAMYYLNAEVYLIDPQVMALSKAAAIGISLGLLVLGLAVYEGLCRSPLAKNDAWLSLVLLLVLAVLAWGLTRIFSGRGAFIHYGLGNLFFDQMDMLGTRQTLVDIYTIYDNRLLSVEMWTGLIENYARPRQMSPNERRDLFETLFTASGW